MDVWSHPSDMAGSSAVSCASCAMREGSEWSAPEPCCSGAGGREAAASCRAAALAATGASQRGSSQAAPSSGAMAMARTHRVDACLWAASCAVHLCTMTTATQLSGSMISVREC